MEPLGVMVGAGILSFVFGQAVFWAERKYNLGDVGRNVAWGFCALGAIAAVVGVVAGGVSFLETALTNPEAVPSPAKG